MVLCDRIGCMNYKLLPPSRPERSDRVPAEEEEERSVC